MRKYGHWIFIIFIAFSFVSCVEQNTVEIVYKEGIDPSAVPAFTEPASPQAETPSYAEDVADGVMYFTENGSVWHRDRECSSLKRSTNVLSGTVEEAEAKGKAAPCKRCAE